MKWLHESYGSILKYLVRGEVKVKYKNRLLGVVWAVLDPLMLMLIYLVLIKFIFHRGGPAYAVELLCGLITFRWFSTSIVSSARSLLSNGKLIQTVKFPYTVLPLSRVVINGIDMLVGFLILFAMAAFYKVYPTVYWLWLPVLIALQFQFVFAFCLIVSIVGIYFRDLLNILQFAVRILVYASPILYGIEQIPSQYQFVYKVANPIAPLIISYKNTLIYGKSADIYLLWFMLVSAGLWAVAYYLLKTRKNIAKDI